MRPLGYPCRANPLMARLEDLQSGTRVRGVAPQGIATVKHVAYLAVTTSTIDPLPHQISAVYEEMLPRQPLRFLLADDAGAGKTIMAGLLIDLGPEKPAKGGKRKAKGKGTT